MSEPSEDQMSAIPSATSDTTARATEPPRTLSDIPGLGPIRVRALQKAGLSNLAALRSADIEALRSVPGLTDIKARHIHQYLQAFAEEDLAVAPSVAPNDAPAQDFTMGADYLLGAGLVVQRATRAMGEVITLLVSPEAANFRSRLLRVLGQFALCAESIATDAPLLSQDQQARAVRRLRRAVKVLSDIRVSTSDRKEQGRVADALEELTSRLAECRLSP